jgi:hypothetical protein
VELDQSRYCLSIIKKYLDPAGAKKVTHSHTTPLPMDFVPMADDCSIDDGTSEKLIVEYNLHYTSCIGSLIYLAMTRTDIIYAINKLAKFSRRPGKVHFEALLHVLRYLRDNCHHGIRFYSNSDDAPIMKMLKMQSLQQHHPFFGFSDSSWNDDVDSGRSTGCFILTYMGGVVDHSSNLPDPVALSSAGILQKLNTTRAVLHSWQQVIFVCYYAKWKTSMNLVCNPLPFILTAKVPLPWETHIRIPNIPDIF